MVGGGKGHLETARTALAEFRAAPEVIALAKKPDRVFTTKSEKPVNIEDRTSSSLLLKRVRDEVHRFAISFHKKLRGKRLMASPLESIPGIGKKRRLELLKRFKSLDAIRRAGTDELASVPGMNRSAAEALRDALKKQ